MRCFFVSIILLLSFSVAAQSEQLAKNYFDQADYEKALSTYQKLAEENPGNATFFFGVVSSHQQLREFGKAEKLLLDRLENSANQPTLLVELGHNYELQKNSKKAAAYYEEALKAIESRPNYAFTIARGFEKYSLLEQAVKAYEVGMKLLPDANYFIPLARLYGEMGEIGKMFENYLGLVESNPDFLPVVYQNFSQFITEDPENEANVLFRKILIKKSQEEQKLLYNEMLSWLFLQQEEFKKSFLQEKALYKRSGEGLSRILQLAMMAGEKEPETALEILEFLIKETPSEEVKLQAYQFLLELQKNLSATRDFDKLEQEYRQLLETYGRGSNTLDLQLDFARFLAFDQGSSEEAVQLLRALLENPFSKNREASVKMILADVLVLQEKFNQALIYYSQVQHLVKNDVMAQEARFKVAKTSYYKGDFQWAKTQLDVLKSSTSQLIANDAMEMSLLLSDNSLEDTSQAALKLYARADLLGFQQKNSAAIEVLEEILLKHKGQEIEDEALLKQAELFAEQGDFPAAEENYLALLRYHGDGILADNASYRLAELYAQHLNDPEKAQEFYEKIIFNYADSIYFVDARKKFRELRGDGLE